MRKRHPLAADGPIEAKTGRTTAADHWMTTAPARMNAAPDSARPFARVNA